MWSEILKLPILLLACPVAVADLIILWIQQEADLLFEPAGRRIERREHLAIDIRPTMLEHCGEEIQRRTS
jgi:hypothetical protein